MVTKKGKGKGNWSNQSHSLQLHITHMHIMITQDANKRVREIDKNQNPFRKNVELHIGTMFFQDLLNTEEGEASWCYRSEMELRICCLRRNPYMFPYDTTTQANLKVFLFLFTIPSSSSQPIFYLSVHPSQRNSYSHSPSSRTSSSSSSSLHHNNHFMKWKLESTAFFLALHNSW